MAKENLKDETSVKVFRRAVDEKLKDATALDEANKQKQVVLEKQIEAQEKILADELALLEKMKADYLFLADSRKNDLQKAEAASLEKLRERHASGKIDITAFLAGRNELKRETSDKLAALELEFTDGMKIIRAKHLHVLNLSRDLLSMKLDFFYLESAAPELSLRNIEELLKTLSARRAGASQSAFLVQQQLTRVKDDLDRAAGKALTAGHKFDSLAIAGVRNLRFMASIPEKYSTLLEQTISEIEANEKQRLAQGQFPGIYRIWIQYRAGSGGTDFRIDWSAENENSVQVVKMGGKRTEAMPGGELVQMAGKGK